MERFNYYTNEMLDVPVSVHCKGDVSVPPPSDEEKQLQQAQLDILKQQQSDTNTLKPFLYESLGLSESVDPATGKTILTKKPKSETDIMNDEIYKAQLQREKDALAGNLPIDPATEKDLSQQEAQLRESLSRQLGPGWEKSTPGQQALATFQQKADIVRGNLRRGDISATEGMLYNRLLNQQGQTQQAVSNYATTPNRTTGLFQNYQTAQQPYYNQRMTEYNNSVSNSMQNQANQYSLYGGLIKGASTLGGAYMMM